MAGSFVKLCTAALAGSIIGIAYERLPPATEWPSFMKSVSAAGSIVPNRNIRSIDEDDRFFIDKKLPVIDSAVAAENFKHSGKYGLPSGDNLRLFNDFILSYDRRLRAPSWVFEHLTPEKLDLKNASRKKSRFLEDDLIHEYFRAKNADLTKTGYDRGHMAAAGNHKRHQDDMDQTFALSNMTPQQPVLNQGAWERLETYVRWRAKRAKNLYVVTGPLFLPMKARDGNLYVTYRVLGRNHVSVPTHYYKVFLVETKDGKLELEAFSMPNDNTLDGKTRLDDYRISIDKLDAIERAAGILLFNQVDRSKIEAPQRLPPGFKEGPRDQITSN